MIHILLNLSKIDSKRIKKTDHGETVRLTLSPLITPSSKGVTHALYHKVTAEDIREKKHKHFVGSGIDALAEVGGDDKIYLNFAEGGGAPSRTFDTKEEAMQQASFLAEKLGKKVYLMGAICVAEPGREVNEEMNKQALSGNTMVDTVPKKRKRIPVKPQPENRRPNGSRV